LLDLRRFQRELNAGRLRRKCLVIGIFQKNARSRLLRTIPIATGRPSTVKASSSAAVSKPNASITNGESTEAAKPPTVRGCDRDLSRTASDDVSTFTWLSLALVSVT
jgi:hypothetical protein